MAIQASALTASSAFPKKIQKKGNKDRFMAQLSLQRRYSSHVSDVPEVFSSGFVVGS
jgi:hypothetical protein